MVEMHMGDQNVFNVISFYIKGVKRLQDKRHASRCACFYESCAAVPDNVGRRMALHFIVTEIKAEEIISDFL